MKIGIIGPARAGKSTIFHLLTGISPAAVHAHKHDVLHGMSHVPDERVETLAAMTGARKAVHITVEFLDTPPLDAGVARTDWFAAVTDSAIKHSDALLLVVRAFGADELAGGVDVLRDIRAADSELVLADWIVLEKRLEKLQKQRRLKPLSAEEKTEIELLQRASAHLNDGFPLRTLPLEKAEKKTLRGFQFLSEKPLLAVINIAEDDVGTSAAHWNSVTAPLASSGLQTIALCAKLEADIADLPPEEQPVFMAELGLSELACPRLLRASFALLDLLTFLTNNEKEARAWPLHRGATVLDAAAVVHTDLARHFIRAEVVAFNDFVREGGFAACKAKGLLRLEGREYIVQDGDIVLIRHGS